jgi:hypothetical protein
MRVFFLWMLALALPAFAAEDAPIKVVPAVYEGCHNLMTEHECSEFLLRLSRQTGEAERGALFARNAQLMRERERACSCRSMARNTTSVF